MEARAPPLLRVHPDPPAVPADDVARDGQAETGAAAADAGAVDLVEALEDAGTVRLGDADAVIRDRRSCGISFASDGDTDLPAVGAELHRVVDEVDEHLLEALLVSANRRHAGLDLDGNRDALPVGEQPQPLGGCLREPPEIHVVMQPQLAAALDPREIQQLAGHLDEVTRLDLDLRDPL